MTILLFVWIIALLWMSLYFAIRLDRLTSKYGELKYTVDENNRYMAEWCRSEFEEKYHGLE